MGVNANDRLRKHRRKLRDRLFAALGNKCCICGDKPARIEHKKKTRPLSVGTFDEDVMKSKIFCNRCYYLKARQRFIIHGRSRYEKGCRCLKCCSAKSKMNEKRATTDAGRRGTRT